MSVFERRHRQMPDILMCSRDEMSSSRISPFRAQSDFPAEAETEVGEYVRIFFSQVLQALVFVRFVMAVTLGPVMQGPDPQDH